MPPCLLEEMMSDVDPLRVRKCLLFRPGSIGDAVAAIPAVALLQKQYPEAEFSVFSNATLSSKTLSAATVLAELCALKNVYEYPGAFSPALLYPVLKQLRTERFDTVVYLGPERTQQVLWKYRLFFLLAAVRQQRGFTCLSSVTESSGLQEHESNRILRWLGEAPLSLPDRSLLQSLPGAVESAQSFESELSTPYLCICTGGKFLENQWPAEKWKSLVGQLASLFPGYGLAGVGGAADAESTEQILAGWKGSVRNYCGTLSVLQTAQILSQASVMISHDTGPIHLAAMAGTPCLGIYGDRNPAGKWYPFIAERVVVQSGHLCAGDSVIKATQVSDTSIAAISVADVLAGAQLLKNQMEAKHRVS